MSKTIEIHSWQIVRSCPWNITLGSFPRLFCKFVIRCDSSYCFSRWYLKYSWYNILESILRNILRNILSIHYSTNHSLYYSSITHRLVLCIIRIYFPAVLRTILPNILRNVLGNHPTDISKNVGQHSQKDSSYILCTECFLVYSSYSFRQYSSKYSLYHSKFFFVRLYNS